MRVFRTLALVGLVSSCATSRAPASGPAKPMGARLDLVLPHHGSRGDANLGALAGKVVLVDFWATWCGPCHAAAQAYERMHKQYAAQGLDVYGVSLDDPGAPIDEFVTQQGITYPILEDPGAKISGPKYEIDSIPVTIVADRHGMVRFTHTGFDEGSEVLLKHEVELLLAEK